MKQLQLFSRLALFGLFESRWRSDLSVCVCVLYLRLNETKPEVWAAIAAGTSPTPLLLLLLLAKQIELKPSQCGGFIQPAAALDHLTIELPVAVAA